MSIIKRFVTQIRRALVVPLLALFLLTTERDIILSDVRRWVELTLPELTGQSDLGNLLALLAQYREFRDVYYYRLFQGSSLVVLLTHVARVFYKEAILLFIRKSCNIGPGLFIQHGYSTDINADIGKDCWINQQVIIGYRDETERRPTIGNNVKVFAGAKVLGNITIGDNVMIGANAVVVKDVPANCVVGGVPAYIIKRNGIRVEEKL